MSRSASEDRKGRPPGRALLFAAALGVLSAGTSTARADDSEGSAPLRWDPAWTHAGPWLGAAGIF